jgi:hypothetical protein
MTDFQEQLEQILVAMKEMKDAPRKMGRLPTGTVNSPRQISKKAMRKRKKK